MLNKEKLERYKCSLDHFRHETNNLWHITGMFLLPHTILLAFVLKVSFEKPAIVGWNPAAFVITLPGIALCILWWFACARASSYFLLRRAQAQEVEPPD